MKFQGPSRRARSLVNAEGHNDKDSSCTTSRAAVFFLATRENSLWDFVSIYFCFTLTQPFSLRGRERAPLAWNIVRMSQMQNSDLCSLVIVNSAQLRWQIWKLEALVYTALYSAAALSNWTDLGWAAGRTLRIYDTLARTCSTLVGRDKCFPGVKTGPLGGD